MTPLSPSLVTEIGTVKLIQLGAVKREDSTGRSWRYSLAGGTTLGRGKLAVAATVDAQRINLSFATAPAAGDKDVSVTIGTGAATANDYQDGWMVVQDGTGEGRAYQIEGHGAITASTAGTFKLKDPIDTAGALAETNVDLIKNFYSGLVISVTDQDDLNAGVPNVAITNACYGWVQTYGPCAVWMDEAVTNGNMVSAGTSVAGSLEQYDYDSGEAIVGVIAGTAGVDAEYQLVDLSIKY